ncbi:MAG: 4-oxalocrotonate tautomerase [Oscillospiraceae bacterium]|nr:4-oxalocrotonate tautomerase [Oscillospiraceae bacterium]
MPVIHVLLWEGRSVEQKRALAEKLTQDMVDIAKVPTESVVVTFQDFAKTDWAEGGALAADKIRIPVD